MGFPAVRDGSDIRILRHIFSPEEAAIATCLSYRHESESVLAERITRQLGPIDDLSGKFREMLKKGGIEGVEKEGEIWYCNSPLVVGMYEMQLGRLTPEFIRDFKRYTRSAAFGLSFIGTELPQMRTIPIEKSIRPEYVVSDFDRVDSLLNQSAGPFVIVECICRNRAEMEGKTCTVTKRKETCLAIGNIAKTVILSGQGREIERDEAKQILKKNQKEGLVLQPSNSIDPEFICSCCGCCCSMLKTQKSLPRPLDYWASNFQALPVPDRCTGCGACLKRCQMDALSLGASGSDPQVNPDTCIGCGQCVAVCASQALILKKKVDETIPPPTREALHDILLDKRKGVWQMTRLALKYMRDSLMKRKFPVEPID